MAGENRVHLVAQLRTREVAGGKKVDYLGEVVAEIEGIRGREHVNLAHGGAARDARAEQGVHKALELAVVFGADLEHVHVQTFLPTTRAPVPR